MAAIEDAVTDMVDPVVVVTIEAVDAADITTEGCMVGQQDDITIPEDDFNKLLRVHAGLHARG